MKSELKKLLFFIILAAVYLLQAIDHAYPFSYVYFFGFAAAVVLLYVIRNQYLGFLCGAAVITAMGFYNTDYIFLTALAFILICAHKDLDFTVSNGTKKKAQTNGFSSFCTQLSFFSGIALLIYSIYLISKLDYLPWHLIDRALLIFIWLILLFVCSITANKNGKNPVRISKALSGNLKFIYLVSIISFSATVLYSLARNSYILINYNALYFPWFVYVCSIFYNDDPHTKVLTDSVENILLKISDRDKVR